MMSLDALSTCCRVKLKRYVSLPPRGWLLNVCFESVRGKVPLVSIPRGTKVIDPFRPLRSSHTSSDTLRYVSVAISHMPAAHDEPATIATAGATTD